jgi:hypothetical protein
MQLHICLDICKLESNKKLSVIAYLEQCEQSKNLKYNGYILIQTIHKYKIVTSVVKTKLIDCFKTTHNFQTS